MQHFIIKRADTSPALRYELKPSNITLAAASVQFQMRVKGGDTVIDASADIVDPSPPVVEYKWQDGDTDVEGCYEAEFRVTYLDGTRETFPNRGFIQVQIGEDIPDID